MFLGRQIPAHRYGPISRPWSVSGKASVAGPFPGGPSPSLIDQAVTANNATPAKCTLLGDQVTDILATHEAGTRCIG